MKILNISFPRVGIEPTTFCVYTFSHTVTLRHDWPFLKRDVYYVYVQEYGHISTLLYLD